MIYNENNNNSLYTTNLANQREIVTGKVYEPSVIRHNHYNRKTKTTVFPVCQRDGAFFVFLEGHIRSRRGWKCLLNPSHTNRSKFMALSEMPRLCGSSGLCLLSSPLVRRSSQAPRLCSDSCICLLVPLWNLLLPQTPRLCGDPCLCLLPSPLVRRSSQPAILSDDSCLCLLVPFHFFSRRQEPVVVIVFVLFFFSEPPLSLDAKIVVILVSVFSLRLWSVDLPGLQGSVVILAFVFSFLSDLPPFPDAKTL